MTIWMLKLCDNHGNNWCVYGTEDIMREAFDQWKRSVESCMSNNELLEVIGFCDDAKRTRYEVRMKVDSIVGAFLTEL